MSGVPRAIVLGGGLSGLCAAFRLRRAGVDVTLIESAPKLPGAADDAPLGPLPPTAPPEAPELMGVAAELGVRKSLHRSRSGAPRVIGASLLGADRDPAAALLGRSPAAWLRVRRLRRLLRWYAHYRDPRAPERGIRLDDRSVADFARLYLGGRAYRELFETTLAAQLGLDGEHTSRLLAISLLDPLGRMTLSHVVGLPSLLRSLSEHLPDVRLGTRVSSIDALGRGVRLEGGDVLAADAVVLAEPAPRARELLPQPSPAEQTMLGGITYRPALQLSLRLSGPRLWSGVSWIAGPAGSALAAIVDRDALLCADPASDGHSTTITLVARPAHAAATVGDSDRSLVDTLLYAAERFVPGIRTRVVDQQLWRAAAATPGFGVGHYRAVARLREEAAASPSRRVILAGDYLVAPHAEGAVCAGARAAEACVAALRDETRRAS